MVNFCLIISQAYLPAFVFNPELNKCRTFKNCNLGSTSPNSRQDLISSYARCLRLHHNEEAWRPLSRFFDNPHQINMNSTVRKPVLIDIQEIMKQNVKREEILKFLSSGLSEVKRGGLDESILADLLGIQTVTIDMYQEPYSPNYVSLSCYDTGSSPLIYPSSELYPQEPLLDLKERPEFTLQLDGRVPFTNTGTEMKDLLYVIAEFYLSKNSTMWRKQSMVVPYFNRRKSGAARDYIRQSSLKHESPIVTVAPLKSPCKTKFAPSQKGKTGHKACRERDVQKQNYSYACESLLSIIVDKNRNGKTAILALKKSGPELPQLLTQFSASIAGTGLALILSVVCKVSSNKVPLCASKLLNTGLGFGLVWLSWAVNRLSDTIISISKNSGKLAVQEKEILKTLDRSVKGIFFRATALFAVLVLRLA